MNKKPNNATNYLTEEKFEERMKSFEENFTKIIINLQNHLETQTQWHADRINAELSNNITAFKDQMLTTFDPLLRELETRQQEREIASYQSQKIHTKLDNHENRISALEHA